LLRSLLINLNWRNIVLHIKIRSTVALFIAQLDTLFVSFFFSLGRQPVSNHITYSQSKNSCDSPFKSILAGYIIPLLVDSLQLRLELLDGSPEELHLGSGWLHVYIV
jgi:hypothetical protein